jgi:biopolymer transport protein ExbB
MVDGGLVFMIPLLMLSIMSVAVILERIFMYGRRTVLFPLSADAINKRSALPNVQALRVLINKEKSLCASIVLDGLYRYETSKNSLTAQMAIEKAAEGQVEKISDNLWILRGIAHISPYIGLFGTVVGLYMAFGNIASVGLSQQSVSRGISIALITTVAGLAISIPTLVAEYCLREWAQRLFRTIKSQLEQVIQWMDERPA